MQDIPHPNYWATAGGMCHPGCVLSTGEVQLRKRAWKRKVRPVDLAGLVEVTAGLCMVCRRCHASIVEHCHFTGRVRGLVCRSCNVTIAFLEGGLDGRHVLYRTPCLCGGPTGVRSAGWPALDGGAVRRGDLEQATYDFLDHAQDAAGHDVKTAFAWLVDHPYPNHRPPAGPAPVAGHPSQIAPAP